MAVGPSVIVDWMNSSTAEEVIVNDVGGRSSLTPGEIVDSLEYSHV